MFTSTRGRFSVAALAAVLVAGAGLLAATPANAATNPTINVINDGYVVTGGVWNKIVDVTGAGFDAGAQVTLSLVVDGNVVATYDMNPVIANSIGSFIVSDWQPNVDVPLSSLGITTVTAVDEVNGISADPYTLSIRKAAGVESNPAATISTADLADVNGGIMLYASGFQPGESVKMDAVYNGTTYTFTRVADDDGTATFGVYLAGGSSQAGSIDFTFTGATSGFTETHTIAVTGDTIIVGDGDASFEGSATAPAGAPTLPVVSG